MSTFRCLRLVRWIPQRVQDLYLGAFVNWSVGRRRNVFLPCILSLPGSSCALHLLDFFPHLPETHAFSVSSHVCAQQNGSWGDQRLSLPVVFTGQYQNLTAFSWPVSTVPLNGFWQPPYLHISKYRLESHPLFLHSGWSWQHVTCKPWTPRAHPFQLLALGHLSYTQLMSLLPYGRDLPAPHHCLVLQEKGRGRPESGQIC